MKSLFTIFTFVCTLVLSSNSFAKTIQIVFTANDSYSVEIARIDVGDTIEWIPENEGHNVEFFAGPEMASLPIRNR